MIRVANDRDLFEYYSIDFSTNSPGLEPDATVHEINVLIANNTHIPYTL